MPSVLPPVTDCGCAATAATTPATSTTCCPLRGVGNPNTTGLIPTDPTIWWSYWQLADLVAGPPLQTWYWNPNLATWQ